MQALEQIPGVDQLDRQVIAALQLNGRASWKDIAEAIGTSETTVARRGKRLLAEGALLVVAYVDVVKTGLGAPALARITCRPAAHGQVLEALRRLKDVRFCASTTGPTNFLAEIVAADRSSLAAILTQELPAIEGIAQIETLSITRTFHSVRAWDEAVLPPEAVQALAQKSPAWGAAGHAGGSTVRLDATDQELVTLLASNGRLSNRELADVLGISPSTISRRLCRLEGQGSLHFRPILSPQMVGFDSEVLVWINAASSRVDEVARTLVQHPSTRFVWATTGRFNLCLGIYLNNISDMYRFETEVLSGLPGINGIEVNEHLQAIKRGWVALSPEGVPVGPSTATDALKGLFDRYDAQA